MMDDDRLRQLVDRVNSEQRHGPPHQVPPEQRPSGWVCPKCGEEASQAASPLEMGSVVMGWSYQTDEDGVPVPINVTASEVVGRNPDGTPKIYNTMHCFNCFNRWQKRKMMEEIRANVPQLVRKPDA